jgi:RyR domain
MAMSVTRVVVDGDVTVDWSLARGLGAAEGIDRDEVRVSHQAGGAALLAELVAQVTGVSHEGMEVTRPAFPDDVSPADPRFHHSWAQWSKQAGGGAGWYVDRNLGTTRAVGDASAKRLGPDTADLVVLDDAGLGFRDQRDRWPAAVADETPGPWVLVKMSAPVASGALWEHLLRWHRERLVVVVRIDDLRRSQVQISRGLSWERTAQDLSWELTHNPDVSDLSRCAHVVVSFGAAGAVLMSRPDSRSAETGGRPDFRLVFDSKAMEGEWEGERPGDVIGGTATLTAFIASGLIDGPDHGRLCDAVAAGLTAVRDLHERGYRGYDADIHDRLVFPVIRVAAAGSEPSGSFGRVPVRDPVWLLPHPALAPGQGPHRGFWTILEETYPGPLDDVARQVVAYGPDTALRGVPHGQFGGLLTVDRHEIESLRAIRGLMEQYCGLDGVKAPLSIAVFGPPGSGKSYGVTQVASSVRPGRIKKLEFNLSQFGSPDDLNDAFHQVRDTSLTGQIPLVFWDEFDTPLHGQPLGWLRYFLAPMQDGAFRQGQIVHPIGRAIFVFAGGTASSIDDFGRDLEEEEQRAAKQPDFASRLRGYLNVLGPNPQPDDGQPEADRFYLLRRAIVLEHLLRAKAPYLIHVEQGRKILSIDRGVLQAFLEVSDYRHGTRSMEAIIDMSQLTGHSSFQRSSLPSEAQLDLHVSGRHFLALVQRLDLSDKRLAPLVEQLAAANHDNFRNDLERRGYQPGEMHDEGRKISPKLRSFDELSDEDKEQNRAAVRDIPRKLALVGYIMTPARSEEYSVGLADVLEELARHEHDRWMTAKIAAGWIYGTPTDEKAQHHEALLPWEALPESQKEKDRAQVADIPGILSRCGYTAIPVPA